MGRGEIWTASGGPDYAGKPRPVLIVSSSLFQDLGSVAVCLFTTRIEEAMAVRPLIQPDGGNGLRADSQLMIDKVTSVAKSKLGERVGVLSDQDMIKVNRSLMLYLGLAG
jgi:mRNA interferase MazF